MGWFQDIAQNPFIDVALLVDDTGKLVASSDRSGTARQRVASMLKAAETLARGLSAELGRGEMHMLQLSTRSGHLIALPAGDSHYLIVLTSKSAPLELLVAHLQRVLNRRSVDELGLTPDGSDDTHDDDWNVAELIDAVSDWLHDLHDGNLTAPGTNAGDH